VHRNEIAKESVVQQLGGVSDPQAREILRQDNELVEPAIISNSLVSFEEQSALNYIDLSSQE
jgi:hypothetical protein